MPVSPLQRNLNKIIKKALTAEGGKSQIKVGDARQFMRELAIIAKATQYEATEGQCTYTSNDVFDVLLQYMEKLK